MPEVLEVELTRRAAQTPSRRRIEVVERTDPLVVATGVDEAVVGRTVEAVDRRGKVLLLRTDGPLVAVHFGMTGRLLRSGAAAAIDRLAYGAGSDHERWDRLVVALDDGSRLRVHDPRRLGRVWLEPVLDGLGPDALVLTRRQLATALEGRRAPLKAVLLDQSSLAGLGNMLVDEVLWHAASTRGAQLDRLTPDEITTLQRTVRRRLPIMLRRGGSHTGVLSPDLRRAGASCPRDAMPLATAVVGGRTTIFCPAHQR